MLKPWDNTDITQISCVIVSHFSTECFSLVPTYVSGFCTGGIPTAEGSQSQFWKELFEFSPDCFLWNWKDFWPLYSDQISIPFGENFWPPFPLGPCLCYYDYDPDLTPKTLDVTSCPFLMPHTMDWSLKGSSEYKSLHINRKSMEKKKHNNIYLK